MNETEVTLSCLVIQIKFLIYLKSKGLDGYEVIDPHSYPGFEEMVALVERRKGANDRRRSASSFERRR